MKKIILMIVAGITALSTPAQDKYFTKAGHIDFFSATPMENIEAKNDQVASILDIKTGELVITVLMKSFEFERALMEEHFNENYVESEKFPKSKFSGSILNIGDIDFSKPGKHSVTIQGELTIRDVTKPVKTMGELEIKEGNIVAVSSFKIMPEDYNIKIPGAVKDKIAKELDVHVSFNYAPYAK